MHRFRRSIRDPDIVVIPERVFQPRAAGVRAADVVLVVEIVSPGSRGTDHVMKLHEYAKAGIENYWIVDPETRPQDRFLACRLVGDSYRPSAVLTDGKVRLSQPAEMEFTLDMLTGR